MNLRSTLTLFGGQFSDNIQKTVGVVFNKKIGKQKGLDRVEKQIRDAATEAAQTVVGQDLDYDTLERIDNFIDTRLGYIKNSFKKLNNPKTNKSDARIERIGDTEEKSARWFGETIGHESTGQQVMKSWLANDPCPECEANEAQGPIPVDEDFQSGDYAPLAHPDCQCELEYSYEGEDES